MRKSFVLMSVLVAAACQGLFVWHPSVLKGAQQMQQATTPSAPSNAPDITGTYELTKRVMSNGTELRPPTIVALYTLQHGRGNFNLFLKGKDGAIASESTISRYTLSATQYCEWIVYTTRNNLDKPGVTNEAPPVTDHCSQVTVKDGRIVFTPPGEGGVTTSFDKNGFTATIPGQFVDYWQKVR